jgi:hypothetical protein
VRSETSRQRALEHFALLRAHLEDDRPFGAIAREYYRKFARAEPVTLLGLSREADECTRCEPGTIDLMVLAQHRCP